MDSERPAKISWTTGEKLRWNPCAFDFCVILIHKETSKWVSGNSQRLTTGGPSKVKNWVVVEQVVADLLH